MQKQLLSLFGHQVTLDIDIVFESFQTRIPLDIYNSDTPHLVTSTKKLCIQSLKNQNELSHDLVSQNWQIDFHLEGLQVEYKEENEQMED